MIKILYWIALHPADGDDKAVDELWALRFPDGAVDVQQTRERTALYAVKLLGRLARQTAAFAVVDRWLCRPVVRSGRRSSGVSHERSYSEPFLFFLLLDLWGGCR